VAATPPHGHVGQLAQPWAPCREEHAWREGAVRRGPDVRFGHVQFEYLGHGGHDRRGTGRRGPRRGRLRRSELQAAFLPRRQARGRDLDRQDEGSQESARADQLARVDRGSPERLRSAGDARSRHEGRHPRVVPAQRVSIRVESVDLDGVLHLPEDEVIGGCAVLHGFGGDPDQPHIVAVSEALARSNVAALRFAFRDHRPPRMTLETGLADAERYASVLAQARVTNKILTIEGGDHDFSPAGPRAEMAKTVAGWVRESLER